MRADEDIDEHVPEPVVRRRLPSLRIRVPERTLFVVLGLGVVAAVFLNSFGLVTPDTTPQLYYAPGRTLVQALFAWSANPFLGQAQFNAGIAPDAAFILLIRSFGVSTWVVIRVWRSLLLLAAGWGAVRFYRHLAGEGASAAGRLA